MRRLLFFLSFPLLAGAQLVIHNDGYRPPTNNTFLNEKSLKTLDKLSVNVYFEGEKEISEDTYRGWFVRRLQNANLGITFIPATEKPRTYPTVVLTIEVGSSQGSGICYYVVLSELRHLASIGGVDVMYVSSKNDINGMNSCMALYGALKSAVESAADGTIKDIQAER